MIGDSYFRLQTEALEFVKRNEACIVFRKLDFDLVVCSFANLAGKLTSHAYVREGTL